MPLSPTLFVPGLLPQLCLVCSCGTDTDSGLCPDCLDTLPWQPPGCRRCGLDAGPGSWQADLCEQCQESPPAFDACHAVFDYCTPVVELVSRFKYRAGFAEGRALASLLALSMREHYGERHLPDVLIPVPAHRLRLRDRGFNQAMELARMLSARTGITVNGRDCLRLRQQQTQRGLNARERALNMRDAFGLRPNHSLARHRHVAIIDDVVTTTATSNELARCLRQQLTARIDVWALARVN